MPELAELPISLPRFVALLREALRTVGSAAVARDPRREFGPAETRRLARGGFDLTALARDAVDPVARTMAEYAALLGSALDVKQAAERLGVDASRVRQQLAERSLYGIKVAGEWRLPGFQFGPEGRVPAIEKVVRVLPRGLHPVEVWSWFTTPNADLVIADAPVSPRDWLLSGGDAARAAAMAEDL